MKLKNMLTHVTRSKTQQNTDNKIKTLCVMLFTLCITSCLITVLSQEAYAEEGTDLMSQVKEIRSNIDTAQNDYLNAIQQSEQCNADLDEARKELSTIQANLNDKRASLGEICKIEYQEPLARTMLNALLESDNLGDLLQKTEYATKLMRQRASTAAEVQTLETDSLNKIAEIESRKAESDQKANEAQESENSWRTKLDEMRPQLETIRSQYLATVAGKSGSEQLSSAISYLEDIDGMTDVQQRLLKAAYSTPYAGSNFCEKWTMNVYRNAGISIGMYATAWDDYKALRVSDDVNTAPVGALAYSSGTGIYAGHVGIVVAAGTGHNDALILDNEGARTRKAVTVAEWNSWMRPSPNNGKTGMFGWGYPRSITLEPVEL